MIARIALLAAVAFATAASAEPMPRLPPVDADCVRDNTPPAVLDAMTAAAPDNHRMIETLTAHYDTVLAVARACNLPQTSRGRRQLGQVEAAISLQRWSTDALTGDYRVPPATLEKAWTALPATVRKSFWADTANQNRPALAANLISLNSGIGVRDDQAFMALAAYALARSYIERAREGEP